MKRRQGYSGKQSSSAPKIKTLDWGKLAKLYDQLTKDQIKDRLWTRVEGGAYQDAINRQKLKSASREPMELNF